MKASKLDAGAEMTPKDDFRKLNCKLRSQDPRCGVIARNASENGHWFESGKGATSPEISQRFPSLDPQSSPRSLRGLQMICSGEALSQGA